MVGGGSPAEGRYLLDTNVVVAFLNRERQVLAKVEALRREGPTLGRLFVPSTVLGELYFGARKSSRAEENLGKISGFAARAEILPCDAQTAKLYGEVKEGLRRKGRPIPENDVWIGALALQHGLILVTRDSHFEHVANLSREAW